MKSNLLLVSNLLISAGALYLFKVYGSLSSWWVHLSRQHADEIKESPGFYPIADQLHILAIVLLLTNLTAAISIWRLGNVPPILSIGAIALAACGLGICLLVTF